MGLQAESLKNLRFIGKTAYLRDSKIKDLGELQYIGLYVDFTNTEIKSLKNLKCIKYGIKGDNKYNLKAQYKAMFDRDGNRIVKIESFPPVGSGGNSDGR